MFFKDIKTLNMDNDIILKILRIAAKMEEQHDRYERLMFGVRMDIVVCNDIKVEGHGKLKLKKTNKAKIKY